MILMHVTELRVRQRRELVEMFGFETRNKYEIATESGEAVNFARRARQGPVGRLGG